jgi:capsular exopolysaccharide synthesis family protein
LIIMGAIAFLIEYLDDTLKTPEEINRLLDLAVIGLIGEMTQKDGKDVGAYVSNNPRSPIAESFRTLRTNLDFASVDRPIRTLLVTSAGPGEGKTTTAVNLAAVIAQGEKKVALVDSDLRRPTIHKFLQLPNQTGLTDLFRDRDGNCHTVNSWGEGQLSVYTSGEIPPNPTELLGSEKMGQILARLSEENDIVILDSAPFIFADPIVMAAKVDGVLLVVEPGNTKIDSAQAMLEQLQRAGARVVGVVLNPITRKQAHYYYGRYRYYSYYYTHGYEYYTSSDGSRKRRRSKTNKTPD